MVQAIGEDKRAGVAYQSSPNNSGTWLQGLLETLLDSSQSIRQAHVRSRSG